MDMAFRLFIPGVAPGNPSVASAVAALPPTLSSSVAADKLAISWSGAGTLRYADELASP
jgi:hypothetical protein